MRSGEGLAVMSMVPVEAKVRRDGAEVDLQIVSEYPFRDEAVIEVTTDRPVTMELLIRIPGFAKEAFVMGRKRSRKAFTGFTGHGKAVPGFLFVLYLILCLRIVLSVQKLLCAALLYFRFLLRHSAVSWNIPGMGWNAKRPIVIMSSHLCLTGIMDSVRRALKLVTVR